MIKEKEKRKMLTYEKGTLRLFPKSHYAHYIILYCRHCVGEDYLEQLSIRFDGKTAKYEKSRIET
jgi:hypothetical protein